MARFTTPMYRAPEMVDTWTNYFVGTPVDVWAIGCILYTLCFMKHPFEDSAKLRILNANYSIPPDPKLSCFSDIISKLNKFAFRSQTVSVLILFFINLYYDLKTGN